MKIKLKLPEKTLVPLRDGTYFFYDGFEQEIDSSELLRILQNILPYLEEVLCDDEKTYQQFSNMLSSYRQIKVIKTTTQKLTEPIKEEFYKTKEEYKEETKQETKKETKEELKEETKQETKSELPKQEETVETKPTTRRRTSQKKQ